MKYFQKLTLGILLFSFIIQCSDKSNDFDDSKSQQFRVLEDIPQHIQELENVTVFAGDSEPRYSIELIQEQVFSIPRETEFSRIQRSAVDDQGKVIILDSDFSRTFPYLSQLHVYNADGSYHTQIGGPGEEPGEYGLLFIVEVKAGKVFLVDFTYERLNVYNADDFSFERSTQIEQWAIMEHEFVQGLGFPEIKTRNDGNHLALFGDADDHLIKSLLMDTDGNVLDFEPLTFPKRKTAITAGFNMMPYMGRTVIALSNEDDLYSIWTQDFLIKKYDANGIYQSAIYYPIKGALFNPDEFAKTLKFKTRGIMEVFKVNDIEVPESFTISEDMRVDDENRIWVAIPAGEERESYEWWILEESGELHAKLLLPREQQIFDIKNGYLYSKRKNEETDTESVIKYRINLTEKN
ncbi:MAG: 6-bladed beta-propeller [Balneolaceae bacterium]